MKTEKKEIFVTFRVTVPEYERLQAAARQDGSKKVSNYLRKKVFSGDQETERMRQLQMLDTKLNQMIFQIRKAGVNVNQIAHSCNAGYFLPGWGNGVGLTENIEEMERVIRVGFAEIKDILEEKGSDGDHKINVSEGGKKE